ncbi:hypothetical protein [Hymenobacter profundi]|uniref:Uncharacterized protein n=1 Tax=Hymenobacter profundi TaxID=1982110 RepID=A0ABS6WX28_9BACT|nr:hypothetical protein [Hymenobacter profundi]MBW3127304.1 hypothetical protein [Hymenobacter profundi]
MKLPSFLEAARRRWLTQADHATPDYRQAGEQALTLAAEAYAQTPAYNHQLQLDELHARIRRLEADLVAERTAVLKLHRQLDQQNIPTPKRQLRAQLTELHTAELTRLRRWLSSSETTKLFTHTRLLNLQTELRRRINHLERSQLP